MNDDTKFLLERIDRFEERFIDEIGKLRLEMSDIRDTKNKTIGFFFGVALVSGGTGALIANKIAHMIGG